MGDYEEDHDLFAVFGDDDDEGEVMDNEASRIAKSLVDLANQKVRKTSANTGNTNKASNRDSNLLSDRRIIEDLWLDHPPLYMGPIKVVSSLTEFGGGRAFVAQRDLEPGTLVLLEEPLVTWDSIDFVDDMTEDSFPLLVCLGYILQLPNAEVILHAMEEFHPTKLALDNTEEKETEQITGMMNLLKVKYAETDEWGECLQRGTRLRNRDGSTLQPQDLLRNLAALRYNALQSGLFLFSAMLNHEDSPNCVKFKPSEEVSYSEVRTTKSVLAGEVLTISWS